MGEAHTDEAHMGKAHIEEAHRDMGEARDTWTKRARAKCTCTKRAEVFSDHGRIARGRGEIKTLKRGHLGETGERGRRENWTKRTRTKRILALDEARMGDAQMGEAHMREARASSLFRKRGKERALVLHSPVRVHSSVKSWSQMRERRRRSEDEEMMVDERLGEEKVGAEE